MNTKVLLVDDEPNVLEAYRRNLRKRFTITTALSGAEGLAAIKAGGPFAVIVSDMRMPEMDGIEFLAKAKQQAPDTVRIMLTGNADQQTAVNAVNQGDIFKFLNKPCSPEQLTATLQSAIHQYQLVKAEQELLENTLKASIETLAEMLSLASPEVFGRTTRLKRHMKACAKILHLPNLWELESAALLSQIGCITLPDELTKKVLSLASLSDEEADLYKRHPLVGAQLIAKIPRLETIAATVKYQHKYYDGSGVPDDPLAGEEIPIGARIMRLLLDFDTLETAGLKGPAAVDKLRQRSGKYDPRILDAFAKFLTQQLGAQEQQISVAQLSSEMILAEDVYTKNGALLVCKGQQVSDSVAERLTNFWHNGHISNTVKVLIVRQQQDSTVAQKSG